MSDAQYDTDHIPRMTDGGGPEQRSTAGLAQFWRGPRAIRLPVVYQQMVTVGAT
jgi:hypothetical protein